MSALVADHELAEDLFRRLADESRDEPGVTRDAYGVGEQRAHDVVAGVARELGLDTAVDPAGNLYMTRRGSDSTSKPWVVGSHLDSVPHGGNYDGAAGVIAGLAALAGIQAAGLQPRRDVTVMAIRAEESTWFPASYIGSRAAFGLLPAATLDLARADTGRTLREHMRGLGLRPDLVAAGTAHLRAESIQGFVEVHIEQGPTLDLEEVPVGLVTGIAGSFRYRAARCLGSYGHSGAVPRRHRQDAVFAAADLVIQLDRLWDELEAAGSEATITFGELSTNPDFHAFSKIPGEVRFCVDARSADAGLLDRMEARLLAAAAAIERTRGVRFDLGEKTGSTPALLDISLRTRLAELAASRGIPVIHLPSGAGHDAATFANAGVPSAMIFVRNQNGSHNPEEGMRMADFHRAADLLAAFLLD